MYHNLYVLNVEMIIWKKITSIGVVIFIQGSLKILVRSGGVAGRRILRQEGVRLQSILIILSKVNQMKVKQPYQSSYKRENASAANRQVILKMIALRTQISDKCMILMMKMIEYQKLLQSKNSLTQNQVNLLWRC